MALNSVLPSASTGYLPYFLLLGSAAGSYNALQTHVSSWQTKEIYGKTPDQGESFLSRGKSKAWRGQEEGRGERGRWQVMTGVC